VELRRVLVEEAGNFYHGLFGCIRREKGTISFLRGRAHSKGRKESERKIMGCPGKR